MTTMLSPGTRRPATCSFGASSTKEGSSSGSSQVGDFQSKNSCLAAAEKPGQVLVFLLPTQEGKTAAGVESRPRPPGANRAERSGWLKCTAAGVRGGLPPRLVPPARVREMWTPGWADFLSGNLLGCLHQAQVCSPGRLSRQKTWAWGKFIFEGCVSLLVAVQLLNRVWLLATPWTVARQAPLFGVCSTPRACSDSCSLTQWCHPAISSSVVPFSSRLQSFPASGSFKMSRLFTSGGQSIGASAWASVLPMNIQGWSPLELTGWIFLQFKGLSRVFSNTTIQNHQFFGTQLSL